MARSWPRGLSSRPPAYSGTPLGLLEPIGQQHMQHIAEARSALARGAVMASRRRCAIVHATPGAAPQAGGVVAINAARQLGLNCFLVRARTRGKILVDRASVAYCSGGCVVAGLLRGKYAATKDIYERRA